MKALRYYGVRDIRVEEIEKPCIRTNEVLVRVEFAGICGSDLHIYREGMFMTYLPETLGHEFVGIIEHLGENVQEFQKGDVVIADPRVPCGVCSSCRGGYDNVCSGLGFIGEVSQGCFAEFIAVKGEKLIKARKMANLEVLALTEPLAVALHLCKNAGLQEDDNIAVIGVGPIGLLTILVAKEIYHINNITAYDLSEDRLQMAVTTGATYTTKDLKDSNSAPFDKVIEAAGTKVTLNGALEMVKPRGTVLIVGLFEQEVQFDPNPIVYKEVKVIGNNAYNRKDLEEAVELITSEKVRPDFLISEIFKIDRAKDAFELLGSLHKPAGKILLKTY